MANSIDRRDGGLPRRLPPAAFNVIERAFRPPQDYPPAGDLDVRVDRLRMSRRFRSALDEVLVELDKDPEHPIALMWAMRILGESRTDQLEATEPLEQWRKDDSRLDAIFTVCSHCKTTEWVSVNCLPELTRYRRLYVSNPIGLQCYACGYVVCRKCLTSQQDRVCPNCLAPELTVPVFPTGRLPRQMPRKPGLVLVHALVFREGPVPPDPEYIRRLLEQRAPDTLAPGVTLGAYPVRSWPTDMPNLARAIVELMRGDGKLPFGDLETDCGESQDDYGNRIAIARVLAEWPDDFISESDIENLISGHLARLETDKAEDANIVALCDSLRGPSDALTFTIKTIKQLLPLAAVRDRHCYDVQKIGRTTVVVSVLPAVPTRALTYLEGGYLSFLDALHSRLGFDDSNDEEFVHWIWCQDWRTGRREIHTTFLFPTHETAIFAVDLLTPAEKMVLNL